MSGMFLETQCICFTSWLDLLARETTDIETSQLGHTSYRTAGVGKRVRSTNVYHSRQCGIELKPCSHSDYTAVCFITRHRAVFLQRARLS